MSLLSSVSHSFLLIFLSRPTFASCSEPIAEKARHNFCPTVLSTTPPRCTPPVLGGPLAPRVSPLVCPRLPLSMALLNFTPVPRLHPSPSSVKVGRFRVRFCHLFMNRCTPISVLSYHSRALFKVPSSPPSFFGDGAERTLRVPHV